jgi:hypothetical protein
MSGGKWREERIRQDLQDKQGMKKTSGADFLLLIGSNKSLGKKG